MSGHCLFDTALGRAGVAWSDRGITVVQFPEATDERTLERLHAQSPIATALAPPPPSVAAAIEQLRRHFEHGQEDLSTIALDMSAVPPFYQKVYDRARRVGPGRTVSYGELARELGSPTLSRAVGTAMAKNPFVVVVPCHRVASSSSA